MSDDTDFGDDFAAVSARTNAKAMEALQELWHRIPYGTEITLSDGSVAIIKKFTPPKVMIRPPGAEDWMHEQLVAGVDIKAKDGSWHLEFHLVQTGWGGAP